MKSVVIAIQPYYVFLIIAHLMGWDIPQEKTEEVRKDFPKDSAWNKTAHIYCSKNTKSFNRIPAKYRPLMQKFLGKVIGEFVCDSIRKGRGDNAIAAYYHNNPDETCLTDEELVLYANYGKPLYFWHISGLKIYDKPKELGEFRKPCGYGYQCKHCDKAISRSTFLDLTVQSNGFVPCDRKIIRPPQSWCYSEA